MKIKLSNIDELNCLLELSRYQYETGNKVIDLIFDSIIERIYYKIDELIRNAEKKGPKKSYSLNLEKFEGLAFYELYHEYSKTMDITTKENVVLFNKMTSLDKQLR